MMTELMKLSLAALAKLLESQAISSTELTQYYLERSKTQQKNLNAYITISQNLAMETAGRVDELRRQGKVSPLAGIPMALKDNILTRRAPTTCASRVLKGYLSPFDAAVAERLHLSPMLGKASLDEFAMGTGNETSAFGPVANPWDLQRVPGGSSGGSAALVAAGCAPFSLGSDTGGSIRQPAAFCGVTGFKPTYGRVSRRGLVPFASSLDQIGPITRSIADCAMVLQAICGHDPGDATSSTMAVPDFSASLVKDVRGLRIGLPRESFANCPDVNISNAVEKAAQQLEKAGAVIHWVSMPYKEEVLTAYMLTATAEASSNLARIDGVNFGLRGEGQTLEEMYRTSRQFGATVRRRLLLGTFALTGDCSECHKRGQGLRQVIARHLDDLFQQCHVLLLPTTPSIAYVLEKEQDPLTVYYNDIYTIPANLAGLPAVSVPCGLSNGLPTGMQLLAPRFREDLLLRVGYTWQCLSDWHLHWPQGVS